MILMAKIVKVEHRERCIGCNGCVYACARTRFGLLSIDFSAIEVKTRGGMENGFVVIVCRGCLNPVCARACPTDALEPREGGGVKIDLSKCDSCGACRDACSIGAITMEPRIGKPIVCTQCGACVKFCPHDVLEMKEAV